MQGGLVYETDDHRDEESLIDRDAIKRQSMTMNCVHTDFEGNLPTDRPGVTTEGVTEGTSTGGEELLKAKQVAQQRRAMQLRHHHQQQQQQQQQPQQKLSTSHGKTLHPRAKSALSNSRTGENKRWRQKSTAPALMWDSESDVSDDDKCSTQRGMRYDYLSGELEHRLEHHNSPRRSKSNGSPCEEGGYRGGANTGDTSCGTHGASIRYSVEEADDLPGANKKPKLRYQRKKNMTGKFTVTTIRLNDGATAGQMRDRKDKEMEARRKAVHDKVQGNTSNAVARATPPPLNTHYAEDGPHPPPVVGQNGFIRGDTAGRLTVSGPQALALSGAGAGANTNCNIPSSSSPNQKRSCVTTSRDRFNSFDRENDEDVRRQKEGTSTNPLNDIIRKNPYDEFDLVSPSLHIASVSGRFPLGRLLRRTIYFLLFGFGLQTVFFYLTNRYPKYKQYRFYDVAFLSDTGCFFPGDIIFDITGHMSSAFMTMITILIVKIYKVQLLQNPSNIRDSYDANYANSGLRNGAQKEVEDVSQEPRENRNSRGSGNTNDDPAHDSEANGDVTLDFDQDRQFDRNRNTAMSPTSSKRMDSVLKVALREINYWNHIAPVHSNMAASPRPVRDGKRAEAVRRAAEGTQGSGRFHNARALPTNAMNERAPVNRVSVNRVSSVAPVQSQGVSVGLGDAPQRQRNNYRMTMTGTDGVGINMNQNGDSRMRESDLRRMTTGAGAEDEAMNLNRAGTTYYSADTQKNINNARQSRTVTGTITMDELNRNSNLDESAPALAVAVPEELNVNVKADLGDLDQALYAQVASSFPILPESVPVGDSVPEGEATGTAAVLSESRPISRPAPVPAVPRQLSVENLQQLGTPNALSSAAGGRAETTLYPADTAPGDLTVNDDLGDVDDGFGSVGDVAAIAEMVEGGIDCQCHTAAPEGYPYQNVAGAADDDEAEAGDNDMLDDVSSIHTRNDITGEEATLNVQEINALLEGEPSPEPNVNESAENVQMQLMTVPSLLPNAATYSSANDASASADAAPINEMGHVIREVDCGCEEKEEEEGDDERVPLLNTSCRQVEVEVKNQNSGVVCQRQGPVDEPVCVAVNSLPANASLAAPRTSVRPESPGRRIRKDVIASSGSDRRENEDYRKNKNEKATASSCCSCFSRAASGAGCAWSCLTDNWVVRFLTLHHFRKRFCSRGPNILLRRIYLFLYLIRILAVVYGVLSPLAVSFNEHTVQHHTATALMLMANFLYTVVSMIFYQLYLYNRKPFKKESRQRRCCMQWTRLVLALISFFVASTFLSMGTEFFDGDFVYDNYE